MSMSKISRTIKVNAPTHALHGVHLSESDFRKMDTEMLRGLFVSLLTQRNNCSVMPAFGSLEYGGALFTDEFVKSLSRNKIISIISSVEGLVSNDVIVPNDAIIKQHCAVVEKLIGKHFQDVREKLSKINLSDITIVWSRKANHPICVGLIGCDGKSDVGTVVIDVANRCVVPFDKVGVIECKYGNSCTNPVCTNKHLGCNLQACGFGLRCKNANTDKCTRVHYHDLTAKPKVGLNKSEMCRFDGRCTNSACVFKHTEVSDASDKSDISKASSWVSGYECE